MASIIGWLNLYFFEYLLNIFFVRDQWSHPIIDNPAAPLHCQKEELISRLEKKIEILSDEKKSLNEDLGENKKLGKQVTLVVEQKCQSKQELNKYKLYVDELDQVTYLLLKLSGRLAKAENALNMLPDHASESERAVLTAKRDELHAKHEDAKDIKEGIDRRSQQVAAFLTKYLTAEEFTDYEDFIKMKLQLTIEFQEIDDRVKQSEEQLKALKHNMRAT
ncbi:hypothetical protein CAPTEDRAFT_173104 [Capitella teleta]|uniref:ASD2 domain-containing protein n=1 Tax=Capitella teleta TaxID=283909 RepID=R7UC61_CAPTE|nr:hypothetical protein CAPTEDRAFT_173104 [Capitella teleta]|eukprot:ELU03935.1 hypothetical protein CAPTEDRAFT_173104 [Capitella teleta]